MTYTKEGYTELAPLSEARQIKFSAAPALGEATESGKDYQAVFETTRGRIVMELYAADAPMTVGSFVYLIRHHYYDGIVFHRVIQDFMAQTGDPTGTGSGGPGYSFGDEFNQHRHDSKGVLSMANRGPDTNGSQLFMLFAPQPHLNGKHTVFGKVVEGLDVLDKLTRIQPGYPGTPDKIERAYVLAK